MEDQSMPMASTRGHKCGIPFVPEDLYMFRTDPNPMVRFMRFLKRIKMATRNHPESHAILRSYYSFILEHRKQNLHPNVIHPFSPFWLVWQGIMAITLYTQFVNIPLDISLFDNDKTTTFRIVLLIWKFPFEIICVIDIVLRFFVGYVNKKQEVVLHPAKIAAHYIFGYFVFDVISAISTLKKYSEESTSWAYYFQYFAMLKFVRIFTFATYCKCMAKYFSISFMAHGIAMLVVVNFLFIHLVTCLNIYIIYYQRKMDSHRYAWRKETVYSSFIKNYANCLYMALSIINYLGTVFTHLGKFNAIYTIIVWIIAKLVSIWHIASIMRFVTTRRTGNVLYLQLISEITHYMRHKHMSERLQKRMLAYYGFRFQRAYFRENAILESLTRCLQHEIDQHKSMKLVENLSFFEGLPSTVVKNMASCLKSNIFLTNDVIFKYGSPGECMYIIVTGSVAVYGFRGVELCHLKDGQYFGEIALVERSTRFASVVAVEVCELYELHNTDFRKAFKKYPHIYRDLVKLAGRRKEAMKVVQMKNLRDQEGTVV